MIWDQPKLNHTTNESTELMLKLLGVIAESGSGAVDSLAAIQGAQAMLPTLGLPQHRVPDEQAPARPLSADHFLEELRRQGFAPRDHK
jgi:hypothetical protein